MRLSLLLSVGTLALSAGAGLGRLVGESLVELQSSLRAAANLLLLLLLGDLRGLLLHLSCLSQRAVDLSHGCKLHNIHQTQQTRSCHPELCNANDTLCACSADLTKRGAPITRWSCRCKVSWELYLGFIEDDEFATGSRLLSPFRVR